MTAAILIMLALVFLPSANAKAASGEGYHVSPQLYFAIDGDSVTYAVDENDPSAVLQWQLSTDSQAMQPDCLFMDGQNTASRKEQDR